MIDSSLKAALIAVMTHYDVDGTNKKFVDILENIVNDIKEGKEIIL